jgi:hypothetical protein
MKRKLIMVTVDTDKEDAWLEDCLSGYLTLKLRPFVPDETAELVTLPVRRVIVAGDVEDLGQ